MITGDSQQVYLQMSAFPVQQTLQVLNRDRKKRFFRD